MCLLCQPTVRVGGRKQQNQCQKPTSLLFSHSWVGVCNLRLQKKITRMIWLSKLISCTFRKFLHPPQTHRWWNTSHENIHDLCKQPLMHIHKLITHKYPSGGPTHQPGIYFLPIYSLFYRSAGWCLPPTLQLMINTCLGFLPQHLHSTTDIPKPPNWGEKNINRSEYMAANLNVVWFVSTILRAFQLWNFILRTYCLLQNLYW